MISLFKKKRPWSSPYIVGCLIKYTASGFDMGKYLAYVIVIVIVLFAIEWFEIVDIPLIEIPDYLSGKEEAIDKTEQALEQLK